MRVIPSLALMALLAVSPIVPVSGQQLGAFRGVVISSVDSSPLGAAYVSLTRRGSPALRASSDSLGRFSIEGLHPGLYALVVRSIGYPPFSRDVTLSGSDTAPMTVVLAARCLHDSITAVRDIARHRPRIVRGYGPPTIDLSGEEATLERRFGFTFLDLGDEVYEAAECWLQYNRVVFRYLDGRYGPAWRDSVRIR